ncbi:tyrosine recombinase XerC [Glutamicibacter sp. M10]|uniref:site-specific integrase n=1 Tax=Glutamicibacter sp. M10 TaxID=3023076 RepID=UPI0021C93561|nr:site-specific integrase [Glutamicibacter sp. M10]UXN30697.1 site-specific integrase [Glutamicibacter sp. M10]
MNSNKLTRTPGTTNTRRRKPSTRFPKGGWLGTYVDPEGKERGKTFARKIDAQSWAEGEAVKIRTGTYISPTDASTTMKVWSEHWLKGQEVNRPSSVRQAKTHIKRINATFGDIALKDIRPTMIKNWLSSLKQEGLADSTIYALYRRLAHLLSDAVEDGLLARTPTSRKVAPSAGKQRPYVASEAQVWALYDAMPEGMKNVVLLGAFAGLRVAEISALRVQDVDSLRGYINPAIQYPGVPLKTAESKNPIPIPRDLAFELNKNPAKWGSETFVTLENGRPAAPYTIESRFRTARATVEGLPEDFRIHDLRHFFASFLIDSGEDVKKVQSAMRHASAKTTLDVYGHLMEDAKESTRSAVAGALANRADSLRTKRG